MVLGLEPMAEKRQAYSPVTSIPRLKSTDTLFSSTEGYSTSYLLQTLSKGNAVVVRTSACPVPGVANFQAACAEKCAIATGCQGDMATGVS
jgi:hypothetical protein